MNLFDMAHRSDPNLVLHVSEGSAKDSGRLSRIARLFRPSVSPFVRPTKRRVGAKSYRGLELSGGAAFTLKAPYRWSQFRALPTYTGWQAVCLSGEKAQAVLQVAVTEHGKSEPVAIEKLNLRAGLVAVPLPDTSSLPQAHLDLDITVRLDAGPRTRAFLAVHEILDRTEIIALCKGKGVELGPGLNPQIRPSDEIDITYIEQATPEQWESLYNDKGKLSVDRSLWTRYVQGNAYPLPVASESLDFIFSSHVFEHLANPIGHLEHWYGKLRKGGVVAAIVPDCAGCKDYVFEPTSLEEVERERLAGGMDPELRHFERWAAIRAPGQSPARFMNLNRSIHVHFYSRDNMHALLERACRDLGFDRFQLRHVPNHKDFYFALWK